MRPSRIVEGDLLFHAAHGLCRVDRLVEQAQPGKKVRRYSLVPKISTKMKVRFDIAEPDMEVSGFHRLISVKEANKILHYLRGGDHSTTQIDPTWGLARNILSFSADRLKTRDQRKRQLLEHSVKGLVGELSCAFKTSLRKTASRIEKSLAKIKGIDPLVFAALGRAAEE